MVAPGTIWVGRRMGDACSRRGNHSPAKSLALHSALKDSISKIINSPDLTTALLDFLVLLKNSEISFSHWPNCVLFLPEQALCREHPTSFSPNSKKAHFSFIFSTESWTRERSSDWITSLTQLHGKPPHRACSPHKPSLSVSYAQYIKFSLLSVLSYLIPDSRVLAETWPQAMLGSLQFEKDEYEEKIIHERIKVSSFLCFRTPSE